MFLLRNVGCFSVFIAGTYNVLRHCIAYCFIKCVYIVDIFLLCDSRYISEVGDGIKNSKLGMSKLIIVLH